MWQSAILILVFLSVSLLVIGIYFSVTVDKRALAERMNTYTAKVTGLDRRVGFLERLSSFKWKSYLEEASKIFAAQSITKKMQIELIKANIPLRGEEYILINFLLMFGLGLLLILITRNAILGWIGVITGFMVPKVIVKRMKLKRVQKFNSQIGDALVVMSNSMRAGFSFLQATEMVSKEMPSPICDEFARTLREMNLGTPTEEALLNLTTRIESEDLDLVITAVLIQRQVGGNLAEILDGISHTIRERIRIKGEIKTLTAQGRVSGIIVGVLPVVIGLVLSVINPSYIGVLFTNPTGWAMLTAGVISQTIGIALIKKTVDIKV
ncbi:MAG: secretion system protein [Firmicutes bacterium HGW-Firmicutes-8]|nr:MAG: secretion system protein [Firmicutes bacterium HGW-Firmicutes-8]